MLKKYIKQQVKGLNPVDAPEGSGKDKGKEKDDDDTPPGFQRSIQQLNHIFGGPHGYKPKCKQKLTDREINMATPTVPNYLRWSEVSITFDRTDHPDRVVHPWFLILWYSGLTSSAFSLMEAVRSTSSLRRLLTP